MSYRLTGIYYYEPALVEDTGATIEEEKWELMEIKSDENLCDMNDSDCHGDLYYTDQVWAITHWCEYHFKQNLLNGTFKRIGT